MTAPRCPCGTVLPLDQCCGLLHDGSRTAATAEQLMRSRYSAFVLGNPAYLLATWHPRTRPPRLDLDRQVRWTGLDVVGITGGSLLDREGTVEFRAHYVLAGRAGAQHENRAQHENSRFLRQGAQWRYLDGVSLP